MGAILLRWCYTSGNWYEFTSDSSAQVGQLYRLKVLESGITKVEVIKDGIIVIEWSKENE